MKQHVATVVTGRGNFELKLFIVQALRVVSRQCLKTTNARIALCASSDVGSLR